MHTITIKKHSVYMKHIEYIGKQKPLKHSCALKARYIKIAPFKVSLKTLTLQYYDNILALKSQTSTGKSLAFPTSWPSELLLE